MVQKPTCRILLSLAITVLFVDVAKSDIVLSSAFTTTTIDFDSDFSDSNFGKFAGNGLTTATTNDAAFRAGRLDSSSWRINTNGENGAFDGTFGDPNSATDEWDRRLMAV